MESYLVTGGAGFIGSNIVRELVKRKRRVRVLDNLSTGKQENVDPYLHTIEFIRGDIRDLATVRKAVEGMDYVLHQAALPSVPRSIEAPLTSNEVNVTGTLNVLLAARDSNIKRVVYASSSSIYGDTEELPKRENMPVNPLSPYAVSKQAGESYCRTFSRVYGLKTTCLRYFNVFGPQQDPYSQYSAAIPRIITKVLDGELPIIYGDGTQSRDFTYVANVVEANLLVCENETDYGQVYNVGCGLRISLLDVIEALESILQIGVTPKFEPSRVGEVKHSCASIEKLKNSIGYAVKVSFKEGLDLVVDWYRRAKRGGSMEVTS